MKIYINYHSSWSNSFYNDKNKMSFNELKDGKIKENKIELFRNINEKVQSLRNQTTYPNYKLSDISHNTVFGILSRITGDIRRISDINNGIIKDIESKISFINNPSYSEELVFLRNSTDKNDSRDQNRVCGFDITRENNVFDNKIDFNLMFGFFYKNFEDFEKTIDNIVYDLSLYKKIAEKDSYVFDSNLSSKKLGFYNQVTQIDLKYRKLKNTEKNILIEKWKDCWYKLSSIADKDEVLKIKYSNITFELLNSKNYEMSSKFFLSRCIHKLFHFNYIIKGMLFYTDGIDISDKNNDEIKKIISRTGVSSLIKKRDLFVSKNAVPIKGGPYIMDDGFHKFSLIKKDGNLIINIDANKEEEKKIYSMIYCSAVNSFHLGKKGLAYIDNIELIHNEKLDIEEELE